MAIQHTQDLEAYRELLHNNPAEVKALYQSMMLIDEVVFCGGERGTMGTRGCGRSAGS
jgi:hypothetical protein